MTNRELNNVNINVEFEETANRQQISSGDNVKILFGKIKKWLSGLHPVAFSGSYNDLTDKPSANDVDAVSTKPDQELTDEEKKNARENIGAAFDVTSIPNTGSSSTPVYFQNGLPVECISYSEASVKHASTSDSATNDSSGTNINTRFANLENKPTIYASTSTPSSSNGKNGDLWVVYS